MDMPWPELPYPEWAETCAALHLYCQIVGKYRLARTPWVNHSWHATLYVDPIGLGTGPVMDGDQAIEVRFDLKAHSLVARGRILARRRRSDRLSAFYSYAYPAPPGFADAPVAPGASFFSEDLRRVHSAL